MRSGKTAWIFVLATSFLTLVRASTLIAQNPTSASASPPATNQAPSQAPAYPSQGPSQTPSSQVPGVPPHTPATEPPANQAPPANQPPAATPTPPDNGAPTSDAQSQGTGQEPPIAQEPAANDQGSMFVFKKQVDEVVLDATVLDDQRRLVPYLDRNAFTVFEDGVPQTITSFRREDIPV